MHWFWNGVAAAAFWLSNRAEARCEADIARARDSRDASAFWSDVQAWADGLGPWRELRGKREPETGRG